MRRTELRNEFLGNPSEKIQLKKIVLSMMRNVKKKNVLTSFLQVTLKLKIHLGNNQTFLSRKYDK